MRLEIEPGDYEDIRAILAWYRDTHVGTVNSAVKHRRGICAKYLDRLVSARAHEITHRIHCPTRGDCIHGRRCLINGSCVDPGSVATVH